MVEEVGTKNKNHLKENLWGKWKIVILSDVESDMHTELHSLFFFEWIVRKAWDYEKSVPAAQIAPTAWGILQLVVSLNVTIALAVPLEVLGNVIKYFDRW